MPEISLIILTYNSEEYIGKLLESLISRYKNELKNNKLEVIVADNKSSDATEKKVKEKAFDNIVFIQNGDNFGFAKGINLASQKAKGEFLLFINPDSTLVKGDIFSLKDKIQDKIAVVGGEIIKSNGEKETSCGRFYTFFNVLFLSLGLEEKIGVRFSPIKERFVDFVSGGFMMVKKDFFEKFEGFDENLFMYVEDMEFCYRAKKEGYKIFFSNSATIKHIGQASSNKSFAILNIYKGLLYFHRKHKSSLSYNLTKGVLLGKAHLLVILGKITDNNYLKDTYSEAIRI